MSYCKKIPQILWLSACGSYVLWMWFLVYTRGSYATKEQTVYFSYDVTWLFFYLNRSEVMLIGISIFLPLALFVSLALYEFKFKIFIVSTTTMYKIQQRPFWQCGLHDTILHVPAGKLVVLTQNKTKRIIYRYTYAYMCTREHIHTSLNANIYAYM